MNNAQLLIIAAMAFLIIVLLLRGTRRRKASKNTNHMNDLRKQMAAQRADESATQLKVELQELFREMNARIDTKMHVLNELILDAERKIKELRQLQDESALGRDDEAEEDREPVVVEMDRSVLMGPAARAAKLAATPEPDLSLPAESEPEESDQEPKDRYAIIYKLADDGMTPAEICEATGQARGEVELILGLRRRRQSEQR
ncbi:hypothetical protein Pan216_47210 [Planctomycetes bacterium Pan216]|uniref:DUF2802 domain-containing protein n=1 Tax=Kolteria novifilia TaxID=2527975 RepID=A0A518BA23_9BACT|nr:hypothetical protein Pan216_47210 [Planctomycetes bacterium Pan216]